MAFDIVFRPSSLVGSRSNPYTGSVRASTGELFRLTTLFALSLVLYAVPLTYAGLGAETVPRTVPDDIAAVATSLGTNPELTWLYIILLIENCTYLFAASILTFGAFHVAMVLTRQSAGFLQSVRTITYSTGIYLAMIFSFAWYLSMSSQIAVADEWLIAFQVELISVIADAFGIALEIPGPRLTDIDTGSMVLLGKLALAGLLLSIGYYVYSLYLGARINHQSSRTTGVMAIALVAITPVPYALGFVLLLDMGQLDQLLPALLI